MSTVHDTLFKLKGNLEVVGLKLQDFTFDIDFSDLGSGASSAEALTGFPTNVITLGLAWVEVLTPAAGEADLAVIVGDTNDDNGYMTATNLHEVSGDLMAPGTELALRFESDWLGGGADATFTATELDDVTAGAWRIHVPYITLRD